MKQLFTQPIQLTEPSLEVRCFDRATISLPAGRTFNIEVIDHAKENIFIQDVKLNGIAHRKAYLTY